MPARTQRYLLRASLRDDIEIDQGRVDCAHQRMEGMGMDLRFFVAALPAAMLVAGCAATSSSTVTATTAAAKWDGPVFVSEAPLPAGIKHTVLGTVQADARAGYSGAASLYPLLAAEARKIGANAVISATGGRRVTAFSWAAAYVSGTAVKVEEPEKLKGLSGSSH